jgi:type I restriction enzyme S subunit
MSNKTNTPPMPKLRFPEFRDSGEWSSTVLGELSDVVRGGSPRPIDGFLTTAGNGLNWLKIGDVDKDAKYVTQTAEKVRPEALSKTRVVNPGDLILSNSMSFGRPYILQIKTCIHDGWIAVTHISDEVTRDFLYYLISEPNSQSYFLNNAAGSGVQNLNADIIKALPVCHPSSSEQQKIADCLSSLDELIAAQARKVEALKTHKKGLMQQLFPREGETQPRLRFPEFRDAGDWEALPIGDKVELMSGYPFDGPDISQDITGIPLLRGINVTEGRIRHNPEIDRYFTGSAEALGKYKLQLNDLVIGMDGSKVGKNSALITTADAGALLIQRVARLRAKSAATIQFIYHQINSSTFHRYVDKINTSSGIPHISAKQIKEFSIGFPSNKEQQRITDCITALDTQVTGAASELDALKTHKKGLMQQLFPSAEAMEA